MSANLDFVTGIVTKLDRVPEARTPLNESDVQNPSTLGRVLTGVMRDLTRLLGLWRPRRFDFNNVPVDATGTVLLRLEHRFGGVVRFWVVDWDGAAAPNLRKHSNTTADVLVITSTSVGTATIRVEESG